MKKIYILLSNREFLKSPDKNNLNLFLELRADIISVNLWVYSHSSFTYTFYMEQYMNHFS